jgi:hypothetical protein
MVNPLYIYVGLAAASLGGLVAVSHDRWEHWPKPVEEVVGKVGVESPPQPEQPKTAPATVSTAPAPAAPASTSATPSVTTAPPPSAAAPSAAAPSPAAPSAAAPSTAAPSAAAPSPAARPAETAAAPATPAPATPAPATPEAAPAGQSAANSQTPPVAGPKAAQKPEPEQELAILEQPEAQPAEPGSGEVEKPSFDIVRVDPDGQAVVAGSS